LSALDSQTRELLMDDLVDLWTRQPFTAVYVTHNLAEAVRLGHRVVVLSRRPGQIREVVEIDKPLAERGFGDADLDAAQKHLWTLMREEARAADAELINVPLIAAIFPIPKIALLPLFVIWFGIGEGSKYALIAFGTFTPTVVATYGAVDNVDRSLIRMGQSFGLSWWSIVRKIVLPGAMPGILSGLRISLAIAIILLVAAEMLGAEYGIGAYILEAGSLYDLERLFAGVAILSILGVLVSAFIGFVERRMLDWRT